MKNASRISILLLLIPFFLLSQNNTKTLEVIYVKGYKNYKDTTVNEPKIFKDIEYKLICNNNEGRFEFIDRMNNDGKRVNERFISKGGGKGIYYKNISEKIKLHQVSSSIDEKIYLIKEPMNEYDWVITKDKKTISGYVCYRAYAEYEVEYPDHKGVMKKNKNTVVVWFTPSINFSFGPAGFDGLPGLVLEKYSNSIYIIAKKISFKDENINISKPTKGKEISKDDYDSLLKQQFNERFKG